MVEWNNSLKFEQDFKSVQNIQKFEWNGPMLNYFGMMGLGFSHWPVLAAVVIFGLCTKYRAIFLRATFVLLFTMIYNAYLKSVFQMPLPPPMEGWAFPSGHMHSAFVFWGWIALELHKIWVYEVVAFILMWVAYGLIQQWYHYPIDVLAAVGFGTLSLTVYAFINRIAFFKNHLERVGLFMFAAGGVFFLLLPQHKSHVIIALSLLATLSAAIGLVKKFGKKFTQAQGSGSGLEHA